MQWKLRGYILLILLFLVAVGILAVNPGGAALKKLAIVLDPVYGYVLRQGEIQTYASDQDSFGSDESGSDDSSLQEEGTNGWQVNGNVQIIYGDGYMEDSASKETAQLYGMERNQKLLEELWAGKDYSYLIQNFYIVNSTTYVTEEIFPVEELLNMDLSFVKDAASPQILIHHTHASEAFADSTEGVQEDTVVGMGAELATLLSDKYGYQVIHDKSAYDVVNGKLDRNLAYDMAKEGTKAILAEYPSIQVIIDLHRDSGTKRVTEIDGKPTAQIMFFNGLSRNMNGPIAYLYNPYLKQNLAFSLQLKLKSMEYWEDYTKPIFLKGYEYNLSLLPKSLLIEVGTQENTRKEAINAMEPLAKILAEVLGG